MVGYRSPADSNHYGLETQTKPAQQVNYMHVLVDVYPSVVDALKEQCY